ncbi:MAG TPA: TRAP transporter small permease subunit [Geminicoccaceae bacterium]|jgi:TRAP-type mannitol/chloroaromatic compound transport system permease small subunit|nr:TRAP transporter small permease subunit [Geminicoccaceae bacterium]
MSDLPPVDRLSRALGDRLAWLYLISAGLTCFEVIMDAALGAPTVWVHDTTIMLGATCFLFGGAYALQRRDHIRITFVYDALPGGARRVCDLIGLIVGLVYLVGVGWFAGAQAIDSIMRVERSGRAWDFPMPMVIRTAFFLGTALLALQTAQLLVQLIRRRAQPWQ